MTPWKKVAPADVAPRSRNTLILFGTAQVAMMLALFSVAAAADEEAVETIIVEEHAMHGPAPVGATVDSETLERLRPATNDTARLLTGIAGVSVNAAGGVSSLPSIHGLADDRLRITLDGTDLIASCPNHMNPPLSYVDTSGVGTLTVFTGVAPVSVGGDSIGGTIVAETTPPPFAEPADTQRFRAELGSFYRSNNDAIGGNATASFATETFSFRYKGAWSRADNYTAGDDFKTTEATGRVGHALPLDEVGSTAYETRNQSFDLAFRTDNDIFEARFGYQNMPEELFPNQRMDLLDNEQKLVNLSWRGERAWGVIEARGYYETVDHAMDFGADKRFWYGSESAPPVAPEVGTPCTPIGFMTCGAGMPMYSQSNTLGASVDASYELTSDDVLRLGAEYVRYRLDDYWLPSGSGMWPETFLNINNGHRDRAALFAEWEAEPGSAWHTSLGVRYEQVTMSTGDVQGYASSMPAPGNQVSEADAFNATDRRQTDHNVDLTGLVRYTSGDNLDVEFGIARKVRAPNLYERYTWSTWAMPAAMNNLVGDGNGYVGDVNLKPEVAYTASATVDWHAADRQWDVRATPYYTRVDDYIDAIALPGWTPDQFNVLGYANQSARLYGVDLSASCNVDTRWGEWNADATVSYTDGEILDTGDGLYNIMPLNARLSLGHRSNGWDNSLELILVDAKDRLSGVRNEIPTAGYGVVNLRVSHSWSMLRVDVGVENLFDRSYFLATGGAYLGQGSTMMMSMTPWGTGVPGMGRSAYAGLNLTF